MSAEKLSKLVELGRAAERAIKADSQIRRQYPNPEPKTVAEWNDANAVVKRLYRSIIA